MNIDLSFMKRRRIAINCRTEEELKILTDAIIKEYPKYDHVFRTKYGCWKNDHNDEGLSIRAHVLPSGNIDYGHCTATYYRNNGYKVIEFITICRQLDLGKIESGYLSAADAFAALF